MIFEVENWLCKSIFGNWFLDKNLSNFVSLVWKFHNPYCHSVYRSLEKKGDGKWQLHDDATLFSFRLQEAE